MDEHRTTVCTTVLGPTAAAQDRAAGPDSPHERQTGMGRGVVALGSSEAATLRAGVLHGIPSCVMAGVARRIRQNAEANRATVQVLGGRGDGYAAERLCSSSLTIWGPRTLAGLRPRLDEVR